MARRQVIVQLDNRLVADLDREARAQGVSRSELLRRAAAALLEAYDTARKDRKLVEGYRRVPQDAALDSAFMRLAAESWPE